MGRLWLKVCGITRLEDALSACELGYNAVGMVFAESSRRVSAERAKKICASLPPSILRVGVFAGFGVQEVESRAEYCGLDLIQFHGGEGPGAVLRFGARAIVALRPRFPDDIAHMDAYPGIFALLVDTWDAALPGGTGRTGDWDLAADAARRGRVILAGGLNPANVGEALARIRPFGVDVSSGVEAAPGIKDAVLMKEFARAAREARSAFSEEGVSDACDRRG